MGSHSGFPSRLQCYRPLVDSRPPQRPSRFQITAVIFVAYIFGIAAAQTQSASESVTESTSPSASPSCSESPSATPSPSCTGDWSLYTDDDGSEGVDSCLAWLPVDALDWGSANAACPPGSHLLTIAAPSMPSALWNLSSTLAAACNQTGFDGSAFIGCYQSSIARRRGVGWAWVDGTNAGNLNCGDPDGGDGCGLWAANQPE